MPRVTFRKVTDRPDQLGDILVEGRVMDAVPPVHAQVRFARRAYEYRPTTGRVVDHVWHVSWDNPNDLVVDVIVALD